MARAPVPGRTKTRLEPLLGEIGCARLQAALIRRTVAVAEGVAPGAVFVAYDGSQASVRPLLNSGVRLVKQYEGDLGVRMSAAVEWVRSVRSGPVVVLGTDCPVLGPEHLRAAADGMAAGADVVFGPAHDGGYYLVALSVPAAPVFGLPPLSWGGPEVLARSLAAVRRAGLHADLIGIEHDLDTPADATVHAKDPRVPGEIVGLLTSVRP